MTHSQSKQGSILIYAFLMVVTMGIIALGVNVILQQTLLAQQRELIYTERDVDIYSARNILKAASWSSYLSGDPSTIAGEAANFPENAHYSLTSFSFPTLTPLSRSNTFGSIAPDIPNDGFFRSEHALKFDFNALVTFAGEYAGINSATTGAYSQKIHGSILEIPTAGFQLVTYSSLFKGSSTSDIEINGRALFLPGISADYPSTFSVSDFSLTCGDSTAATSAHNFAQSRKGNCVSWGLSSMSDLFSSTGTGNIAKQSLLIDPAANLITVTWADPLVEPVALPGGVTYEIFDGTERLVLDLASMAESNHYRFICTPATEDFGIVIKGDSVGLLSTVSIVTNGKVSLMGNNSRPCLIASDYSGEPSIYSDFFLEGSTGLPANDLSFKGYFLFEKEGIFWETNENWTDTTFEIIGSLVFRGGEITGPDKIVLSRNNAFINLLSNGSVRCDRFAYLAF